MPLMNAACTIYSNVTFGNMLTAMNSGNGWYGQFFSGPSTGAGGENVSPPTSPWKRSTMLRHSAGKQHIYFFLDEPIAATLLVRHACIFFHASIRRSDCVGPITSHILRQNLIPRPDVRAFFFSFSPSVLSLRRPKILNLCWWKYIYIY